MMATIKWEYLFQMAFDGLRLFADFPEKVRIIHEKERNAGLKSLRMPRKAAK